jgi:hypothetical protein
MISGKGMRILAVAAALGAFSVANAQSVNMWFNQAGSAAGTMGDIELPVGTSSVTLSFYYTTSGVGPTTVVSSMVGFTDTTSTGEGASATSNGVTVPSSGTGTSTSVPGLAWNPTFSGIQTRVGGAMASSGTRPFGIWTSALNLTSTFPNSDGTNTRMFDLTFNLDPSFTEGTVRPITVYGVGTADQWNSGVLNETAISPIVPQSYVANLRIVNPVPEPATMAALGLGALALMRRRRK